MNIVKTFKRWKAYRKLKKTHPELAENLLKFMSCLKEIQDLVATTQSKSPQYLNCRCATFPYISFVSRVNNVNGDYKIFKEVGEWITVK